eukprot:TRINITY_DN41110_c0_g1_i1.p1 TRINITY_DN41110_c0_g1~~TRINITY_DN41110_c0_g1_i1.p1  ORF type:complete len:883 (-),score=173.97 TRINITY_DN41110_c0_g1_i1:85-2733(-)
MVKVAPYDTSNQLHVHQPEAARRSHRNSVIIHERIQVPSGWEEPLTHKVRRILRNAFYDLGWYESSTAVMMRKLLHGKFMAILTQICLFLALFTRDVFVLAQAPRNFELDLILTLVLIVFLFEFIGLIVTDASYFLSFFFWADLLGTFSMLGDLSYAFGTDAETAHLARSTSGENVIVVRAARAAKLGARAGRLSRVMKLLRLTKFLTDAEQQAVKIAKVISNQLTNVLSTRVAFLTICIAVCLPIFGLMEYPEEDESMSAWTKLLKLNSQQYSKAVDAGNATAEHETWNRMQREVQRLADFYEEYVKDYGPFHACFGAAAGGGDFTCKKEITFQTIFEEPRRKSSIMLFWDGMFQVQFDLARPKQEEATASMGLIITIIVVMLAFGLIMSQSISVIALQPLERMLSVVRDRCGQIFQFTDALAEDNDDSDEEAEAYDGWEHSSEFQLLELVVEKLAAIVTVSAVQQEPEMKEDMNENEIMVLNWMQGTQVGPFAGGTTKRPSTGGHPDPNVVREDPRKSCLNSLPTDVIACLSTPHFDTLDLSKEHAIGVSCYVVTQTDACLSWVCANVEEQHVLKYATIVEGKYPQNPYHNFAHAVDVTWCLMRFFSAVEAHSFIPEPFIFSLLIAGIAHDVGHIGVNNPYLVETSHELAVKYNDHSPLENMHCAMLFQITMEPEANVFSSLSKDLCKELRKIIIMAILHTDIAKHGQMMKELGMLYEMNQEAFDYLEPAGPAQASQSNMQLILSAFLHGADVGNPAKPWEVAKRIAFLCLDEFFAQGDLEKATGIPVQMLNDREKVNGPNSQIGFIEFLISPFVETLVNVMPQLDSTAVYLSANIERWAEVWQSETSPPAEALAKVNARVAKVCARLKAVTRAARGCAL